MVEFNASYYRFWETPPPPVPVWLSPISWSCSVPPVSSMSGVARATGWMPSVPWAWNDWSASTAAWCRRRTPRSVKDGCARPIFPCPCVGG